MSRRKPPTRTPAGRRRWLAASSLALATAMLQPVPVAAQTTTTQGQAVKARATYNTGEASYTPGATADLVTVQTTDLLINWLPDDTAIGGGPISFLPAGNGLFFTFDGTNYTVVNRIVPTDATRAIRFDGQVASFSNGFSAIGGNIFFYSPGGIIVGGTGRFDVGSLVLTTSDITSTGPTLGFAASNPGSFVRIEPFNQAGDSTPQIELGNAGSYLAIVAPRIEQHGQVSVNGSVAYVAAESATLTINNGLFDIVVGTGTDDPNGVVHSGTTTGPSSTGTDDQQRTYLTAISKNDAITMLVTGQLGYAQAASADIVNGSIQLLAQTQNPSGGGNIEVGATDFTSDTVIAASDTISMTADGIGNDINFGSATNRVDVNVFALNQIDLDATSGGNVSVFGDLSMYAGNFNTGGIINITVDDAGRNDDAIVNGLIVVGDFSAATNAVGSNTFGTGGIGGDAVGGTINVNINTGGDIFFRSNVTFDASAQAGFGEGQAGSATGGSVNISMTGANSRFGMTNEFGVDALIDTSAKAAVNPFDGPPTAAQGGTSTGGSVTLSLLDGRSQFGNLTVDTSATASDGADSAVAQDNAAFAGDVTMVFSGRTHAIEGTLAIDASSTVGTSFDGSGNFVGGTTDRAIVDIGVDSADLTVGAVSIDASTQGDISASAVGDAITFAASNGATFVTSAFSANAQHFNRDSASLGTAGGIAVRADNASLELGALDLVTTASGNSTVASDNTAGDIVIAAANGSAVSGTDATLTARAVLGDAQPAGRAVNTGGNVSLLADGSTIGFTGGTSIDASVVVPRGGDMSGAVSTGGDVTLLQQNAGAAMTFGNLFISAGAIGSTSADDFIGDGGNAAGGNVVIDVRAGSFASDALFIDTLAQGHVGGSQIATAGDLAGDGGSAEAGDVLLVAAGDSFAPGTLLISASAFGGVGGTGMASLGASGGGAGGAAVAGTVDIQALAGTVDLETFVFTGPPVEVIGPPVFFDPSLVIDASASGGTGGIGNGTAGGAGGDATGGSIVFTTDGADVTVDLASLSLYVAAFGGTGGDTGNDSVTGAPGGTPGAGGNAFGGDAEFTITSGSTNLDFISLDASAYGGDGGELTGEGGVGPGGSGGHALGGSGVATLGVEQTANPAIGLYSRGYGGRGGYGPDGGGGGNGEGGLARLNVANANVNLASLRLFADGYGGIGGDPRATGGAGGAGGAGQGGAAEIDVFGLAGALNSDGGVEITSTGTGGAGATGYGYFGSADGGAGGAGGRGVGGSISLQSRDGATFLLSTAGLLDARGFGGAGGDGGYSYDGYGGIAGSGGSAMGGAIGLSATGGGALTASSIETGTTTLAVNAIGGTGGNGGSALLGPDVPPTPGGNGAADGGGISLIASGAGSTLGFVGNLIADAGIVGAVDLRTNSTGADATGGAIAVDVADGGTFSVTGNVDLIAGALATIGRESLGNAAGGTVDLTMSGPASTIDVGNVLSIDVSAFEQRTGAFDFATATGGDVTGGTVMLDFADGTATVVGDLLIDATAGFETSDSAGRGGTAIAGEVSVLNDGAATLSFDELIVQAFARGSYGSYYGEGGGDGPGGAGGDAFGGSILVSNQGTGSLTTNSVSLDSGATGGRGGDGVGGEGGAAGNGTGGSASLLNGSDLAVQDLTIVANALGGIGGRGSSGFASGIGGQGMGGAVVLSTSTTLPPLNTLTLESVGTGGSGSTSSGDFTDGGDGSQGGDGIGGSVVFELTGDGTVLPDIAEFGIDVSGFGGTGGSGSYGYTNGGDGGDGGAGTGGTLTFASRSGASIDLTGFISTLAASGFGGAGGSGGYGGYGDGVSGAGGGAGGDGGFGTGGTLNLIGQGGAIVSGDIELTATGRGGAAGPGGDGYYSATGPDGANGGGAGGLVTIHALEGSPGTITLGAVTIDASGLAGGGDITIPTTGGSIAITDASTDPAGLITMSSLTATALGAVPSAEASFTMSGDSGPINVTGNALVDVVGDIVFDFAATGQLVVGGVTTLTAGGDIVLTHTGNAASTISIDSAGNFTATAGGDFAGGAGSIVASDAALSITAQNIAYGMLSAGTNLTLNALGGSITGIAGLVAGGAIDLDATDAIAIDDADAENGFTADAGGDVSFGVVTNSNGDLTINAGGSISGGSAINDAPAGSGGSDSVIINAVGDLALTGTAQSLDDSVVLSAGGSISAGTLAAIDTVQAIAGGAVAVGTINQTSAGFTALLQGASVTLDDGTIAGSLRVNALDGSIGGSGAITVGQSVDLDATGDIGFGSIAAGTGLTADAGGSIVFGDASTADNNLTFVAGGNIAGGSASNLAPNGSGGDDSVSLTAGGDVMLTGVSRAENNIIVRGTNIAIAAVNAASSGSGTLDVQGAGTVSVDSATTAGAAAALMQGTSVALGDAAIGGNLRLNATAGDLATTGAVAVGGASDFDATGNIALGSVASGTGFTANAGGDLTFVDVSTADNNLTFVAGGNLSGNSARNLAPNGSGGDDSVSLTAGGEMTLTGAIRAENNVIVRGTNIALAAVDAATGGSGALDVQGTGIVSADSATTAGNAAALIQGAEVALGDAAIGGNLRLNATAGDVDIAGVVTLGGAADFDATGDILFGSITAGTGFTADAGGSILFTVAATSDNNLTFAAGGDISGESASALAPNGSGGDDSVSLSAGGDVTLSGTSRAENNFIVQAANVSIAAVNAATSGSGTLDIRAPGSALVGNATTAGAAGALIEGASVDLGGGAIGGNLRLSATAGNVTVDPAGILTIGGAADFDATVDVVFGAIIAGTGFTANAGNDILFDAAGTNDNNLTFVAGRDLIGVSASNFAGNGSGGDDSVSLTAGRTLRLTGASQAENNFLVTAADVDLGTVDAATSGSGTFSAIAGNLASVAALTTGGSAGATIQGADVVLGDATIGGNLRLNATDGDVNGTGAIGVGGAADFDATGNIVFGTVAAGTGFTADAGGDILFDDAATSDNNLTFVAGGDIDGVSASNLAGNGSGGDDSVSLTAGGDVALTGTSRAENNFIVRGTNVALAAVNAATSGSGTLDARGTGAVSVDSATTAGAAAALIQGTSVVLGDAAIGGNLRLNATAGDIALDPAGTFAIGGAADFDATGDIVFGTVAAGTGFTADAGNDILFTAARTDDNNLTFAAGRDILGESASNLAASGSGGDDSVSLTAGRTIRLTGASQAENNFTASAANVVLGRVDAALGGSGAFVATATNLAVVGRVNTGGSGAATIQGAGVRLDNGNIGGNLRLNATAGDINGNGDIAVGGVADFDATGNVTFGSITAGTGFTANAGGNLSFVDAATSDNNLTFVAGGDIAGNSASNLAGNGSGGDDSVSLTAGGDVALSGTSRAENNFTVRAVNASIAGINAATGGSGALDIQVNGLADVGTAATGGNAAALIQGAAVTLDNGDIGGNLRLNATGGDIAGTGTILVGGAADFDATGSIAFGSITAGTGFTANAGGDLNFIDAATGDNNLVFVAGGGITGNSASNLAGNGSGGDDSVSLTAGGDVTLTGTSRAENNFTARGVNIAIAAVDAATSGSGALDVQASAAATIGSATTGGTAAALIQGADVTLDSGAIGGDLRLVATAGDVVATGTITVGGAADLDASAGIVFGTIAAGTGFTADAGGDISFGDASTADNNLVFVAGGDISGTSASNLAANGSGGNDAVSLAAGGDVTLTGTSRAENSYIVRAANVAFGALNGATSGAGTIDVQATGTIAVASATTGGAAAALLRGTGVTLGSGAIGGDLTLDATAGDIEGSGAIAVGGAADLDATGDVSLAGIDAGGALAVDAGGSIAFAAATAGDSIAMTAGETLTGQSAIAGDALDLRAGSTLTIADAIGGTVALRSTDGAVIVTHDIDSTFAGDGQQVIVSGAAVQIDDVNDLAITTVQATNGDIDIVAAGDLGIVRAESIGDVNLTSTGGGVFVSLAEAGKGGIVPASAPGAIGPAGTQVGEPGPGNIAVSAATDVQGRFIASGDVGILAGGGIDLDGADAGGSIALDSGGSTRVFGTAAAGLDIDIRSRGDVRVTNSEASLEAGGDLTIDAQGLFDTQGFAYGAGVSIRAADVAIGSSGRVGDAELTTSVTFTSIGGPVTLGGEGAAAGFSLEADEFGRIRNNGDLSIFARSEDGEDVSLIVRDLELAAGSGGAMGSGSALLLDSEGGIDVLGALTVSQAGDEAALRLRSNGTTWLDTAGGNLRIEDADGAPTGLIDVRSIRFAAASEDALADIAGLSAAEIDARLAQNDGVVRDEGFLQAGTLHVQVDEAFLVQNSGEGTDFDERRGFAVDVLSVETSESSDPLVVVNGTVGGLTGTEALAAAGLPGGLDPASTFNGCLLTNPASCTAVEPPPGQHEIDFFDPARDVIEEEIDPGLDPDGLDLESQLIDFTPPEEFQDDPLIDDPVTGAGNEDLWTGEPECEPGEGGECPVTEGEETEPAE